MPKITRGRALAPQVAMPMAQYSHIYGEYRESQRGPAPKNIKVYQDQDTLIEQSL